MLKFFPTLCNVVLDFSNKFLLSGLLPVSKNKRNPSKLPALIFLDLETFRVENLGVARRSALAIGSMGGLVEQSPGNPDKFWQVGMNGTEKYPRYLSFQFSNGFVHRLCLAYIFLIYRFSSYIPMLLISLDKHQCFMFYLDPNPNCFFFQRDVFSAWFQSPLLHFSFQACLPICSCLNFHWNPYQVSGDIVRVWGCKERHLLIHPLGRCLVVIVSISTMAHTIFPLLLDLHSAKRAETLVGGGGGLEFHKLCRGIPACLAPTELFHLGK